jgi:hypothetical protein
MKLVQHRVSVVDLKQLELRANQSVTRDPYLAVSTSVLLILLILPILTSALAPSFPPMVIQTALMPVLVEPTGVPRIIV